MNGAFLTSDRIMQNVTPSKNDISLAMIGYDASLRDENESSVSSCDFIDAQLDISMDVIQWQQPEDTTQYLNDNDRTLALQQELYKTQRQLAAVTKERNEAVQWRNHLAQELGQARSILHQERVMHETNVQNALQQQSAMNDKAVQSILSCALPVHDLCMFPQSLDIDSDGNVRNYVLEATVGQGAFGRLVRATHVRTRRKVAVKLLSISNKASKEEVKALTSCSHPNIVKLYEYIVDKGQGQVGLIMELGHMDVNAYKESQKNGLTLSSLRQVTLATLKAIDYLHSQCICHMDIKSDNLLVMAVANDQEPSLRQEHIKLCDFGLVSMAATPSSSGRSGGETTTVVMETTLKGTPRFFAPEMADFLPYNANAADIWSIGCMLLDLTDELPNEWRQSYSLFDDVDDVGRKGFKTGIRCLVRDMNQDGYFDDKFPPSYAPVFDLVRRLLRYKPEFRLTAREALQHEWLLSSSEKQKQRQQQYVDSVFV